MPNDVKNSESVIYNENEILISPPVNALDSFVVYVRPEDKIKLNFDLKQVKVTFVNGDVDVIFPNGARISISSLAAIYYSDSNVEIFDLNSKKIALEDLLKNYEVLDSNALLILSNKDNYELIDTKEIINRIVLGSDNDGELDGGNPIAGIGQLSTPTTGKVSLTVDKTAFSTLFKQNDSTDPFPVNIYTSDLNGDTDYSNYAAGTRTITQEPILSFTWYFGYDYTSKNETIQGVQYSSYVLKSVRPGTSKDPLTQIDTIVIDASQNVTQGQGASFDYHSDSFDKTLEIGYGKGVKPTDIEIVGLNVQDFGGYSPDQILSIENASTATLRYDPELQDSSGKPTGGYVVTNLDYDGKISLNLHIPFNMNAKYDLEFNVHYVDPVSGNLMVMSITKTMVIMPVSSQKDLSSADFVLSSSSPGVNFIGTGNDDFVILGAPDNSADGGRGADYFALNIGDDEIKAGLGDDVVMASSGVDIIYANGEAVNSTDKDQILYNNGRFSSNYDGQTVTIYDGTVGLSADQKNYTDYNTGGGADNYKTDTNKMTQGINLYYGLDYMGEYINSVAPGVYDGRIPLADVGDTAVFVQKQQGGDIILTDDSTVLIAGTRYDDVFTIYSELSQSITLIGDGNSSTNSNAGDSLIFSSLSQSPTGGMVDTSGAQATFNFITHTLTSSNSIGAEVKFGQIEKFAGGNNDDMFIGDNFNLDLDKDDTTDPNAVHGYILNGGGGVDTVDYNQSSINGVTVSAVGSDYIRVGKDTSGVYEEDGANYGIGGVTNDIDKMNNVEKIVGTSGDDTFLGSSSSKFNITYDGSGSGTDKLSYGLAGGSVTVVLGADFNPSGGGGFSGVYIYKYNPAVVDYNYETMVAANPKSDYAENMSTIELTDNEDLIFLELSAVKSNVTITAEFVNVDQGSTLSNRDTVSWYDVDDATGSAVDTSYYTVDTTLAGNAVSITNNTSSYNVNIDSIAFDNNGSSTTQAVVKKYVGGVGGTMFYGSKDTNYTFIGNADTNVVTTAKDTLSYQNADITDLKAINFLIGDSGQVTKITENDGQYVDDYENITVFVGSEGDDKFVYADVDSSGSAQDVVDIIKSYEIDGKGQGTKGDSLEFSKISSTTMNTLVGIHFSTKAPNTTENMYFLSSPSDKFGATDIEGIVATVGSDYYVGTVNYVSTFDGGSSFVNVDLKTLTAEDEGKEALTHFSNFLKAYYSNNSTVLNDGVSDSDGDLQGDIMDFGESAKIEIKLESSSSNSNGGSYVTENLSEGSAENVTGSNLTYFSNVEIFYALEIEAILGGGASTIGSYAFIAGNSSDGTGGSVTLLYNDTSSSVSSSISVDFLSMTTSRGSNKDTFLANNVSIFGTSTDDTFIIGYSEEAFAEIGVLHFYISGGGGIEILDFSNVEEGFTTTSFVNLVTNNQYEVYDPAASPSTAVAVYDFDPGSVYSYSLTHYADKLVYVANPFDNMNITVDFLDTAQEPQEKDSFSYEDYSSNSSEGVIVTGVVGSTSSVNVSRDGYVDNFKNVDELTLTKYKDVLNYSEGMTVEVNADAGVTGDSVEDEVNFRNINDKVVITFSNGSDSAIEIGNTPGNNVSNLKGFDSYVASSGDTQYIIDSSYASNTNNLKLTGNLRPGATSSISFTGFTSGINYDMENKTVAAMDSNSAQKNYKIEAIAITNINLSDFNDTVMVGDNGTQTTFNFQGKETGGYDKLDYSAVNTDMKFDVMASYVATENFVQYFTATDTDSVDLFVNDRASFEISSFDSTKKYVHNIIINPGVDSEMIFSASTGDAINGFTGVAIFVDNGVMKFSDIAQTVSNTNDMVKVTDAGGNLQKTDLYLTDYKDIVEIDLSSIALYNDSFESINGSVSEEFYGSSKDELKLTNFNGAGTSISFDTGTGELDTPSGSLIVKGFGVVTADLEAGGGGMLADTITIIGSYSSYDYYVEGDSSDKVILDYSNLAYVDVRVESSKVVLNTGGSNSDDLSFDSDLKGNVEVKLTDGTDNIVVEFAFIGDVTFDLGIYSSATSVRDSIKFTNISDSTMDMTDIYDKNVSNNASTGMIGTVIFEEDSSALNTNLVFNADGYDPLYDKMVYTVNSRFDNSKISYEVSSNVAGSTSTTGILLDVSSSKIYKQLDYTDPLSIEAPINRTDKYDILQRSSSFADDGKLVFYDVVGTKNDDYMVGGASGVRFDGVGDEAPSTQYGDVTTYSKNTGFGIEVDLKAISAGGVNDGYVEITKFVGGNAVVGSEDYIIGVESLIGTDVDDVFYADETGATEVEYVSGGSGIDVYSYANFTAATTGQLTNVNGFEIIELTTYDDAVEFDNTLIKESFTVKGAGGGDSVSYAKMNTAVLSLGYVEDFGKSYVRINKSDTASPDVYVDTYEDVESFDLRNDNIVNTVLDENLITDNISVLVSYNSAGFDSDSNPATVNVYSLLDLSNTTSNFIIEMNINSAGDYSAGTMGFAIVGAASLDYDRFFGYGSLELSGSGSSVTLAVSAVDTASRSLNTVVDSATYKSSDLMIFKMESNINSFKLDNNAGTFVVNNNGVENFTNFTQYKYLGVKQGTYDIVADNVNSYEYDFSDPSNAVSSSPSSLAVNLDYSNLDYSVAAVYDTGSSSLVIAAKVANSGQVAKKSDTIKGVDKVTTIVLTSYDDSFDAAGKYNDNLIVDMGGGYKDSVTFASSTNALDASFANSQFNSGAASSNVTILNNEVYGLTKMGDSVSLEDNTFDNLFIDGLDGDDTIKFDRDYFNKGVDSLLFVVSTKNVGMPEEYDSLQLLGNGTTSSNAEFISFEKINYTGMNVIDKELSYIFKSNALTITEVDYTGSTMNDVVSRLDFSDTSGSAIIFNITANGGINVGDVANPSSISFIAILSDTNRTELTLSSVNDTINIDYTSLLKGDLSIIGGLGDDKVVFSNQTTVTSMSFVASGVDSVQVSSASNTNFSLSTVGIGEFRLESKTVTEFTFSRENVSSNVKSLTVDLTESSFAAPSSKLTLDYSKSFQDNLSLTETVDATTNTQIVMTDGSSSSVINDTFLLKNNLSHNVEVILSDGSNNYTQAFGSTQSSIVYTIDFNDAVSGAGDKLILSDTTTSGKVAKISSSASISGYVDVNIANTAGGASSTIFTGKGLNIVDITSFGQSIEISKDVFTSSNVLLIDGTSATPASVDKKIKIETASADSYAFKKGVNGDWGFHDETTKAGFDLSTDSSNSNDVDFIIESSFDTIHQSYASAADVASSPVLDVSNPAANGNIQLDLNFKVNELILLYGVAVDGNQLIRTQNTSPNMGVDIDIDINIRGGVTQTVKYYSGESINLLNNEDGANPASINLDGFPPMKFSLVYEYNAGVKNTKIQYNNVDEINSIVGFDNFSATNTSIDVVIYKENSDYNADTITEVDSITFNHFVAGDSIIVDMSGAQGFVSVKELGGTSKSMNITGASNNNQVNTISFGDSSDKIVFSEVLFSDLDVSMGANPVTDDVDELVITNYNGGNETVTVTGNTNGGFDLTSGGGKVSGVEKIGVDGVVTPGALKFVVSGGVNQANIFNLDAGGIADVDLNAVSFSKTILSLNSQGSSFYGYDSSDNKIANVYNVSSIQIGASQELAINAGSNFESFRTINFYSGGDLKIVTSSGALDIDVTGSLLNELHVNSIGATGIGDEYFNVINFTTVDLRESNVGSNHIDVTTTASKSLTYIMNPTDSINFAGGTNSIYNNTTGAFDVSRGGVTDHVIGTSTITFIVMVDEKGNSVSDEVVFSFEGNYESYLQDREDVLNEKGEFDVELGVSDDELTMDYLVDGEIDTGMGVDDIYLNFEIDSNILFKVEGNDLILIDQENGVQTVFENSVNDNIFDNEGNLIASNGELLNSQYQENNIGNTNGDSSDNMIFNDFTTSDYYSYYYGSEYNDITSGETSLITENTVENVEEEKDDEKINMQDIMNYLENNDNSIDDLLSNMQDILENTEVDINVSFDFINEKFEEDNSYIFHTTNKEEEKDSNKQMHVEIMKNFSNMSGGQSY